jgi:hypothetical protein
VDEIEKDRAERSKIKGEVTGSLYPKDGRLH